MEIPELTDKMERDGKVVNEEVRGARCLQHGLFLCLSGWSLQGRINCIKCAVDYAWNLPALAERLGMDEKLMREALADYTGNPEITNKKKGVYLPPIGCVAPFLPPARDSAH